MMENQFYDRYVIARWAYSIGCPIITDAEYGELENYVKAHYPDSPYLKQSWSTDTCPYDLLEKYGLQDLVRNIVITDRTESIPSINTWTELQQVYKSLNSDVTVSYKHDGWNIQAVYLGGSLSIVQTRGRLSASMQADKLRILLPSTIPETSQTRIVMEATISNENWPVVKEKYGVTSQRSAISTLLSSPSGEEYITLTAFDIHTQTKYPIFKTLRKWGFNIPWNTTVSNYDSLVETIKEFDDSLRYYPQPTDGLVVAGTSTYAIRLLSWTPAVYKSYVVGYKEDFGLKQLSIACKIKPIKMANATQTVVPLTNLRNVIKYDLRIGSPIAFKYTSASIAVLDKDVTTMLQETWHNRYDEYREIIDKEELLKGE